MDWFGVFFFYINVLKKFIYLNDYGIMFLVKLKKWFLSNN